MGGLEARRVRDRRHQPEHGARERAVDDLAVRVRPLDDVDAPARVRGEVGRVACDHADRCVMREALMADGAGGRGDDDQAGDLSRTEERVRSPLSSRPPLARCTRWLWGRRRHPIQQLNSAQGCEQIVGLMIASLRWTMLLAFGLTLSCGGGGDEGEGGESEGGESTTGPEVMTCAELPEGSIVLAGFIDTDEPALSIGLARPSGDDCTPPQWSGALVLPADVVPGTYDLSEAAPSLYIRDYFIGDCMNGQSGPVEEFTTGTITVLSVAADCVAAEIDAMTSNGDGYFGVFAAEPRP